MVPDALFRLPKVDGADRPGAFSFSEPDASEDEFKASEEARWCCCRWGRLATELGAIELCLVSMRAIICTWWWFSLDRFGWIL